MDTLNPALLTPGIRKTVLWLRSLGFDTTDSGDGVTNVEAEMEGAIDIAHVHIQTTPLKMVSVARNLQDAVEAKGIKLEAGMIQATYDPVDHSAIVSLYGVSDEMLP